jgi:riboflavin kinase, archaea type
LRAGALVHLDTAVQPRIRGVIFSDLGQASLFMKLDWVQEALRRTLGFEPYPATLNVRPSDPRYLRLWQQIQRDSTGVPLPPVEGGFCSARLYRISVQRSAGDDLRIEGAVLVPAVVDYPANKIEVVAPVRVKEALGVNDGDYLDLEFNC